MLGPWQRMTYSFSSAMAFEWLIGTRPEMTANELRLLLRSEYGIDVGNYMLRMIISRSNLCYDESRDTLSKS